MGVEHELGRGRQQAADAGQRGEDQAAETLCTACRGRSLSALLDFPIQYFRIMTKAVLYLQSVLESSTCTPQFCISIISSIQCFTHAI